MSPFEAFAVEAATCPAPLPAAPLRELAHGALALLAAAMPASGVEADTLRTWRRWSDQAQWRAAWDAGRAAPAAVDRALLQLARQLGLDERELLAVTLVAAAEQDALTARVIAWLQMPSPSARPTLGLLARVLQVFADGDALLDLAGGVAVESGLLTVLGEHTALPERSCTIALPLLRALAGRDGTWPALAPTPREALVLPPRVLAAAQDLGCALATAGDGGLVLRSASPAEARAVAHEIAEMFDRRPLFISWPGTALPPGVEPWLLARRLLPVFVCEPGPGERVRLPRLTHFRGVQLALCGIDGGVTPPQQSWPEWTLPMPDRAEREQLWRAAPLDDALAAELAGDYRHGAGRIAQLTALARRHAQVRGSAQITRSDVHAAAWTPDAAGLDGLATPLNESVGDAALVCSAALRSELDLLLARCRARDGLADALGDAARTRYRCGVRALLSGPSGTGKSLAAQWLATRLGVPLYRVDLASVTSKWIGETEKNLSQLLARAEHADAMLLFDEADALFGKRTDVSDANDRHANAQTNYLLQRIESYDGIIVLTSNSRSRFDSAFTRRLDAIIEFALPDAEQRHGLWRAHLGDAHALGVLQLNRLAALADLSGGHIRNAVLSAAIIAGGAARAIAYDDVVRGLEIEYRKLGRPLPGELRSEAR